VVNPDRARRGWPPALPALLFPALGIACTVLMDWDTYRARVACHTPDDPALAYLGPGGWVLWVVAWSVPAAPLLWRHGRGLRIAYWADAAAAFALLAAVLAVEAASRESCNEWRGSIILLLGEVYLLNIAVTALAWLGWSIVALVRRSRAGAG
jgi:hypothetical protein